VGKTVWLPVHEVFGKGPVPKEAARVIRLAIEKARRDTEAFQVPDWMIIEWIAADFLAGLGSVPPASTSSSQERTDGSGEGRSGT
jgi:hypothetical protein